MAGRYMAVKRPMGSIQFQEFLSGEVKSFEILERAVHDDNLVPK
jgi:hypothetical protein